MNNLDDVTYEEFRRRVKSSRDDISREVFLENQDAIDIKREKTAIKNYGKIFRAVFKISYAKGFQAMSLRDLSGETGLSTGALYRYFSSKEELLSIIQFQGHAMLKRAVAEFNGGGAGAAAELRAVIKAHLFLSEAEREWFYFTFMEARNLDAKSLRRVLAMEAFTEQLLVDILKRGEKEGAFQRRDHKMTASLIKAMQQDWYLKRWKYRKRKISVDKYVETVLELVEAYCLA